MTQERSHWVTTNTPQAQIKATTHGGQLEIGRVEREGERERDEQEKIYTQTLNQIANHSELLT